MAAAAFCPGTSVDSILPDTRETVPAAFSLFYLANGDPIRYGANFGRDADTIASMAGALHGASALAGEWVEKIRLPLLP